MDCKTALALIDAYLDGELDRAEARALEAHLDACTGCALALAQADTLRRALREPALHHRAPPALRERIHAATDAAAHSTHATTTAAAAPAGNVVAMPPRRHPATPRWLGIAAACLLSFGAGGLAMRYGFGITTASDNTTQFERDLFASHWRALAATSPVDVISSDHHTVKPWFAGKIALSPPVQDFAAQGFALVGGRIDYLGTERVAVLVYRHGAHWIDVYVLPRELAASLPAHSESRGYAAETVNIGAQGGVMLTDMDATERARLAALLRAEK